MAKRKASAATKRRLKALRKKHGLGEFSKKKGRKPKARRKTRRASTRAPRAPKRRKVAKKNILGTLTTPFMAGLTFAFVQPIVSSLLDRFFNVDIQDELITIIVAILAKQFFRNKIATNYANAAITIATAQLVGDFAEKFTGGLA